VTERRSRSRRAVGSHMQRYHFHVFDGSTVLDDTGTLLPDLAAAKSAAVTYAAEVLKDGHIGALWDGMPWRLEVTDNAEYPAGHTYFVLNFSAME
jgi:hypothetical protein